MLCLHCEDTLFRRNLMLFWGLCMDEFGNHCLNTYANIFLTLRCLFPVIRLKIKSQLISEYVIEVMCAGSFQTAERIIKHNSSCSGLQMVCDPLLKEKVSDASSL